MKILEQEMKILPLKSHLLNAVHGAERRVCSHMQFLLSKLPRKSSYGGGIACVLAALQHDPLRLAELQQGLLGAVGPQMELDLIHRRDHRRAFVVNQLLQVRDCELQNSSFEYKTPRFCVILTHNSSFLCFFDTQFLDV